MKAEITKDLIEEICRCIVDCGMNRDEACDYAIETIFQNQTEVEYAEIVEV